MCVYMNKYILLVCRQESDAYIHSYIYIRTYIFVYIYSGMRGIFGVEVAQHTSAYVSICQHTSAYEGVLVVRVCPHLR